MAPPYHPATMPAAMELALDAHFGGYPAWCEQVVAMAQASDPAAACLLLQFNPQEGRLVHHWAADPATSADGHPPLLALNLPALAQAGQPVADAVTAIDWAAVHARYQAAVARASEAWGADPGEVAGSVVLDVRRAGVVAQATTLLPGATWRDPAKVSQWAGELLRATPITVYCVPGH
jgi:superoxide dismutase, Fe-Mn family